MARRSKGQGRGWHGDSQAHAQVGRKGGLARAKNRRGSKESQVDHL